VSDYYISPLLSTAMGHSGMRPIKLLLISEQHKVYNSRLCIRIQ